LRAHPREDGRSDGDARRRHRAVGRAEGARRIHGQSCAPSGRTGEEGPRGAGEEATPATTTEEEMSNDEPIVITADEANSTHVDDLLKRQMSLRGEGVTSEPAKRWYYRNWLLFMIVGLIFASLAWMLVEPSFDDYIYTQGKIE